VKLVTTSTASGAPARARSRPQPGRWWRFAGLVLCTALVLVPLAGTLANTFQLLGLGGGHGRGAGAGSWAARVTAGFAYWLHGTPLDWFENSLLLALATVVVALLVGAPAGYALCRARGRAVSAYALAIFLLQSFPAVLSVVPLFLLFAKVKLVDDLFGVGLVYLGLTISVVIWMVSSYFDTIPIELEEAAWLDGCSVLGAFFRIVLRNALPAVLSAAIFVFLFVWNDYLVALVFLRSDENWTLGIGLTSAGHSPALAVLMSLPPVLVFVLLNRYFSIGGVGGALASR
jgi:multiple sugar transport system permease protein